jgi:hypothetical protein
MEQSSMNTRRKWIFAAAALALAAALGGYAFTASSQEADHARHGAGPHAMSQEMMGHGMTMGRGGTPGMMGRGMMGMGGDAATMADMRGIHALLANHDRIKRTVTNLPDGIRTVTESDDPRLAQVIKDHVADMGRRMRTGRPMGLPIESAALRAMYANKDKIKTSVETTDKGVIVTQTSSDAAVVAVLQKHATEVTDLVAGGMQAMHAAMMRNGPMRGPAMGRHMHGEMMQGMPGHDSTPGRN